MLSVSKSSQKLDVILRRSWMHCAYVFLLAGLGVYFLGKSIQDNLNAYGLLCFFLLTMTAWISWGDDEIVEFHVGGGVIKIHNRPRLGRGDTYVFPLDELDELDIVTNPSETNFQKIVLRFVSGKTVGMTQSWMLNKSNLKVTKETIEKYLGLQG